MVAGNAGLANAELANAVLAEGSRYHRLPDVLKPPPAVELELLLAWSFEEGPDGRSGLPALGDVGTASWERVEEDQMVRFYTEGKLPFMTYPSGDLHWIREHLRATEPARCIVTAVNEERQAFVIAVAQMRAS